MNAIILRIDYSKKFIKQLKKAPLPIKKSFKNRFNLFLKDPHNPLLRNHLLTGSYSNCRSINITGDWRAIYSETLGKDGKVAIFLAFGTHSQLYK